MAKSEQRAPDFRLRLKTPDGKTATVGAAWQNERGYINMQINPGVVLDWRSLDGCLLTLFPSDKEGDA